MVGRGDLVVEARPATHVVLAGGISAANIMAASTTGADILHANSALETSPGVKSTALLKELVAAATWLRRRS